LLPCLASTSKLAASALHRISAASAHLASLKVLTASASPQPRKKCLDHITGFLSLSHDVTKLTLENFSFYPVILLFYK